MKVMLTVVPQKITYANPRSKSVSDIFLNITHFLYHFIILIFAKAAYDSGKFFGLTCDEIIIYGTLSFLFLVHLLH